MTNPAGPSLKITTPTDREIVISRAFDAPRDLVFEAWTKPEHVRHWWGWRRSTMLVCEAEVRPGGSWRYVTCEENGIEIPFTGVYQEVTPPERLVHTAIYDVAPYNRGDPAVTTVTFSDEAGRTTVTVTTLYPTKEVRDTVLTSGMEAGAAESYDRLGELLGALV